jgi:peptidoglycan/xylan/chitin deacetylase (PgdA/CDA1 family)
MRKEMNLKKSVSDRFLTEKRGTTVEGVVSWFSQVAHLGYFSVNRHKTQLEKGMLILSIDVDAGSRQLGLINQGRNDQNVHLCFSESYIGEIEALALPVLTNTLNDLGVPATFAIRGQLADVSGKIIEDLLDSNVKHDIGAHGYSHRSFKEFSTQEAEDELKKIQESLGRFGVNPKSFVFPRNQVAHLDLLEKFGYKCYREAAGGFFGDCMLIEKKNELFNIQPSLYLNVSFSPTILKKLLDVAIAKKAPLHLWFHPWSFGETDNKIEKFAQKVFEPFLKYAINKENSGVLSLDTMLSASETAEKLLRS